MRAVDQNQKKKISKKIANLFLANKM